MTKDPNDKPYATSFLVDLDNARYDDQRQVMETIIDEGLCPFCFVNLEKYHKKPILKKGKYWFLTENQWPYENTRVHLLAIMWDHYEKLSEVPPEAGKELFELLQWADKEYQVEGGGFAMRFGDTNYSAGTVAHLHVQFVVPDWNKPDFKPVRIKIGKTKKE
jgi:ATP adenylyltransferase